ncbi:hypothetical protein pb186bvf_007983 [Paramecium bursaria]
MGKQHLNSQNQYEAEKRQILTEERGQSEQFNIAELIGTLENDGVQVDGVKNQFVRVNKKQVLVQKPETQEKQAKLERKVASNILKHDIKKWLPIVKKNRESDHIDFTKKKDKAVNKISNTSQALKYNPIGQKLEEAMQSSKVATEVQIKESVNERAHQKSIQFYTDLKLKRIAKIKSKIYRKIKKRKSDQEKLKLMAQLTPYERREEMEKMKQERAKERVTLRHSTKNKFINQLLRFGGDKTTVKQQQSMINRLKEQMLQKAQNVDDGEYDDENFKEQAIFELENELKQIEENEDAEPQSFGFLEKQRKEDIVQSKSMIEKLLNVLKTNKEDVSDDEQNQDSEQNYKQYKPDKEIIIEEQNEGVLRFDKPIQKKIQVSKDKEKYDINSILKKFIDEKSQEKPSTQAPKIDEKKALIDGLNIKNLKAKYEKKLDKNLVTKDLKKLHLTDDEIIKTNLENFNLAIDENENEEAFIDDKIKDYEEQVPKEQQPLKGWGSWSGFGIKERKPPSQEQLLKKKIQKIKEVQKKRQDAKLDNVIISEKKSTQFQKYLVDRLPYEYQSAKQFDQVQGQLLGPEWNSMMCHDQLVKPKVKTGAGSIIAPVKVPQKISKLIQNS